MATNQYNLATNTNVARWQFLPFQVGATYYRFAKDTLVEFQVNNLVSGDTVIINGWPQQAQPFDLWIDGVLQTRPTFGSVGSQQDMTIYTASGSGSHTFAVKCLAYDKLDIPITNSLKVVTTASAALGAITLSSSLCGAAYTTVADLGASPNYVDIGCGWYGLASTYQTQGVSAGAQGYFRDIESNQAYANGCGLSFSGNGTDLWAYIYEDSQTIGVRANGKTLANYVAGTSQTWQLVKIASVTTAVTCSWEVRVIANAITSATRISNIHLTGGTGIVTTAITPRTKVMFFGDSRVREYTEPPATHGPTIAFSVPQLMGLMGNLDVAAFAQSGGGVVNEVTSLVTLATGAVGSDVAPDYIIFMGPGINDISAGSTTSQYSTAFLSCLTACRTKWASAKMICTAIMYRYSVISTATVDTWNTVMQTDVVAAFNDANTTYVNFNAAIPVTEMCVDLVHLRDSGNSKIAFLLADRIASTQLFSDPAASNVRSGTTYTYASQSMVGTMAGDPMAREDLTGSTVTLTAAGSANAQAFTALAPTGTMQGASLGGKLVLAGTLALSNVHIDLYIDGDTTVPLQRDLEKRQTASAGTITFYSNTITKPCKTATLYIYSDTGTGTAAMPYVWK